MTNHHHHGDHHKATHHEHEPAGAQGPAENHDKPEGHEGCGCENHGKPGCDGQGGCGDHDHGAPQSLTPEFLAQNIGRMVNEAGQGLDDQQKGIGAHFALMGFALAQSMGGAPREALEPFVHATRDILTHGSAEAAQKARAAQGAEQAPQKEGEGQCGEGCGCAH
ncbi:hypothetical protein E3E12_04595 [Formicincola oecophyllae]|uniref:Uncharacterized protein n=1 Tax=Formicincola oecophyllae TaxID=2558361 RepID=A0A4Y6U9A2_9PROT|nr:hypothetical protein [Formicincola oecophyllae]QDH13590.1 hypothetical protein E3E12_04595 [Formicincola oecophyllae]